MDVLVNLAKKYNFYRVSTTLNKPIVFHCVPGAGKSSLIRECCRLDSRFAAVTLGAEDERDLSGVSITKYKGEVPLCDYPLLDEYTLAEELEEGWFAIFGDPIQANNRVVLRAHFTCNLSKRFGKCTAQLLRELGFDVVAEGNDLVQIAGVFEEDPRDTVIYHECEVGRLLRSHSVEAYHISEIAGKTFESVTFVTACSHPAERASAYQCLTRHRKNLLILAPNATYTTP
uniref:TGB1 n=1 Tax=Carya illinoinensis carlavirus 1 TaxID=2794420 RepID=A0A7T5QZF0_9VIRU|nr:TGB1 [Carya illinoinensis carlavirus 1]